MSGTEAREDAFEEIMTVYEEPLLPIVRSILADSGIRFFIRNEHSQNLIGAAPRVNPAKVMVDASRAGEARELLKPVADAPEDGAEFGADPDEV